MSFLPQMWRSLVVSLRRCWWFPALWLCQHPYIKIYIRKKSTWELAPSFAEPSASESSLLLPTLLESSLPPVFFFFADRFVCLMMLFWLGVLGLGSTHHHHHWNQLVYGSFASHRMCLSKCPIKMIQNGNEYLTFAFGALSSLGLVIVPLDFDLFDARRLCFLLSPNWVA